MNYYWVNVGISFNEVLQHGFLWAPIPYVNENGKRISSAGWKHVPNMKKGDVVFCNKDKTLIYVAVVKEDGYPAPRPESREFDVWKKEGNRVEVEVFELTRGISTETFVDEFFTQFNEDCVPKILNSNKDFCEQYSAKMPADAGEYLLGLIKQYRPEVQAVQKDLLEKDVRYYEFPYVSDGDTWRLESSNLAIKTVDKTLSGQKWSCIPQDIVSFFIGAPLKRGGETTIILVIDGKDYEVDVKRRPDGRHKVVLTKANAKLKLQKLLIDRDTLWFERDTEERKQFYAYTKSDNKSVSVPPRPIRKSKPGKTTRKTTGDARVGQDYFKSEVSEVCNGCCVVTGVKDQVPSILIGSHTKSWIDSNDAERMDGHNGLLLAPHVDKLFDKHLITFSKEGQIIVSKHLDPAVLQAWGIDIEKQYQLTPKQQEYMNFHREIFAKKQ